MANQIRKLTLHNSAIKITFQWLETQTHEVWLFVTVKDKKNFFPHYPFSFAAPLYVRYEDWKEHIR